MLMEKMCGSALFINMHQVKDFLGSDTLGIEKDTACRRGV